MSISDDMLEFFDLSASLIDSSRNLPLPSRVVLSTTFCIMRDDHDDYQPSRWPTESIIRRRVHRKPY